VQDFRFSWLGHQSLLDAGLPGQEQVEIGGFARLGDAAVQVDEGFEVVVLGSEGEGKPGTDGVGAHGVHGELGVRRLSLNQGLEGDLTWLRLPPGAEKFPLSPFTQGGYSIDPANRAPQPTTRARPKKKGAGAPFSAQAGPGYRIMPGLLPMPMTLGWLSLTCLTTFTSRRYSATTSQIGAPWTPSPTGAQPATL
jgi:hypothetical protein